MSTKIKLARTDNVLIVDPDYVNDPFIADVMQLCLPKTMKVKIFSIEQFLEYINEGRNIKAMVIFPNLSVACDAVKAGFRTKEIQMPYPASRMMIKSLSDYFSEEDIEKIRYIQSQGIRMFFQTAPFDNKDYSIFKK